MSNDKQSGKYNKISYEVRLKLIQMVEEDETSCVLAGKLLGISSSTAKMIMKKYKESGKVFEKKEDKLKRECLEEYKNSFESPSIQAKEMFIEIPIQTPVYFYIPWNPDCYFGVN